MRIALFAYSSAGTKVFNLLRSLGHTVVGVFTHQPDAHEKEWFTPVSHAAGEAGIPVFFCPSHRRLDRGVAADLTRLAPDLILSVWFRSLLPREALDVCPAINVHASLLPSYRGRCPINWVLINGEKETGVTVHEMTERPDEGNILLQEHIKLSGDTTAPELLAASEDLALALLKMGLSSTDLIFRAGLPQNEEGPPSTFGGRTPADGEFSFTWPARRIHNLVRAVTHPWPGAFFRLRDNVPVYVWKSRVIDANTALGPAPFTIGNTLLHGTSDQALEILTWSFKDGPDRTGIELLNHLR